MKTYGDVNLQLCEMDDKVGISGGICGWEYVQPYWGYFL